MGHLLLDHFEHVKMHVGVLRLKPPFGFLHDPYALSYVFSGSLWVLLHGALVPVDLVFDGVHVLMRFYVGSYVGLVVRGGVYVVDALLEVGRGTFWVSLEEFALGDHSLGHFLPDFELHLLYDPVLL